MDRKVFHLKGKTRKSVEAFPFNKGNGQVGYTNSKPIADAFNAKFGPVAVVLPARETFEGAA